MRDVLRKVNDEVAEGHARVPQLTPEQLKKIIKKEMFYVKDEGDDSLRVRLSIPLVLTVPFPDKESNSILNTTAREVTVDVKNLLYFDSKPKLVVRINESLSIVETTISRKIGPQAPCEVRLMAFSKQQCPVVPLANRSEWIITPLKNVIQFISSEEKALICPNNRTEILDNFGVTHIAPGCYVETESLIIRTTLDKVRHERKAIKLDVPEMGALLNKTETAMIELPAHEFKLDETGLDRVIIEAENIKDYFWTIVIASVTGTVMVIAVVAITIYCKSRKRRTARPISVTYKKGDSIVEFPELAFSRDTIVELTDKVRTMTRCVHRKPRDSDGTRPACCQPPATP